jgi:hypothetical protein
MLGLKRRPFNLVIGSKIVGYDVMLGVGGLGTGLKKATPLSSALTPNPFIFPHQITRIYSNRATSLDCTGCHPPLPPPPSSTLTHEQTTQKHQLTTGANPSTPNTTAEAAITANTILLEKAIVSICMRRANKKVSGVAADACIMVVVVMWSS